MPRKRKSLKEKEVDFIKLCLLVVAILLISYTIISQIIFVKTGEEMGTLTTCFFAAFSFEIIGCVCIKVFKIKFPDKRKENEEDNGESFG